MLRCDKLDAKCDDKIDDTLDAKCDDKIEDKLDGNASLPAKLYYATSHFCIQLRYRLKSTGAFYSLMQRLIYAFSFAVALNQEARSSIYTVYYTHLTLQTIHSVSISLAADILKKTDEQPTYL